MLGYPYCYYYFLGETEYIKFKFVQQMANYQMKTLSDVVYSVNMTTQMKSGDLEKKYSFHVGVPETSLRFLFPKEVKMEQDNVVKVYLYQEQRGGFRI